MREFRFRAWDKEFKKFSENALQHPIHDINYLTDYEWMQYTGLNDKNNKEIYEGDIVKVDGFKLQYYKVEFLEGAFCLTNPAVKDYPLDINIMYPSIGCQLEVVGNYYGNPELTIKHFQGL